MNTAERTDSCRDTLVAAAIARACRMIAPSWPLDRQIAVNPYWGMVDQPFADAMLNLRRLVGANTTVAADELRHAWNSGNITAASLKRAIEEQGARTSPEDLIAGLEADRLAQRGLPLLSDFLDSSSTRPDGPQWSTTITQQISQYCASYFDEHQADWHRKRARGLFGGWRDDLQFDHALESLMHAPAIRTRAHDLPLSAEAAIEWSLDRLGVPQDSIQDLLSICLLRIIGWASWCAYLHWNAQMSGESDTHLQELLAIRLSWEALLHDGSRDPRSCGALWMNAWQRANCATMPGDSWRDRIWQRAQEISYQDKLIGLLGSKPSSTQSRPASMYTSAQLVFCIDVRSERFRRALESADSTLETRGFAGFFGLPIQYDLLGTPASRLPLPGLLSPRWQVTDSTGSDQADRAVVMRRRRRLQMKAAMQPLFRMPSGAFSLVEALGLGYLGALLHRHFGAAAAPVEGLGLSSRDKAALRPHLLPPGSEAAMRKADLVSSVLRSMSLTRGFARLLVLIGHGSQCTNNPQKAALDCGACGGQTGEINARVLADLLNDPSIRLELGKRGIHIPATTLAIAALHNTTTDEVQLFDRERVPASHTHDVDCLDLSLAQAGRRTRAERAPNLGLTHLANDPDGLLREFQRRARDWAQTRPEWGLADNAALIVAPRSRTRHLNLAGRAFLHDYEWQQDSKGEVLELIMTAPMIVAHWINLQYFASTVDPDRFGSGNKLLHNVACGRIGVFEGNTGDLRIGLSRQSVHDGSRWMHTPLRLSVLIEAPRSMIEEVLARHSAVRQLVGNEWLYLFRIDGPDIERWQVAGWVPWVREGGPLD